MPVIVLEQKHVARHCVLDGGAHLVTKADAFVLLDMLDTVCIAERMQDHVEFAPRE
ncbi:hypothetical protein D3C72_1921360 [compost metagenome]